MKKWLVGLMAAGLCVASAWAAEYTLITSASEVTAGNYVIVAGQGDSAMKNVEDSSKRISAEAVEAAGGVIHDPDASLIWTLAKGDDGWTISSATADGTVYAAAPSSDENKSRLLSSPAGNYTLWAIADSTVSNLIAVQSLQFTNRFLQKNNTGAFFACYKTTSNQKDVRFFKEGSPEFTVDVEPSVEFRKEAEEWVLTEGTSGAILTAVAKNGEGEVRFAWTGYFEQEGESIEIPSDLTEGEYSVTVTATDSSEPPQTKDASFTFTVFPAPQAYTVTVADDIENGSVAVWDGETELGNPADVLEGTVLKVVATPATRSYKVESVTVTGAESGEIALVNGEFAMPAENVSVTATFVERTQTAYALVESMDDFEAGADYLIVADTDALKNATNGERIAVAEVTVEDGVVETEEDSIVWRIAAVESSDKYTLYNAAAGVYVASSTTAGMKEGRLVTEGTGEAAQWTIDIDTNALATIGSMHEGESLLRNTSHPYFAAYKGGTKPSLYKKVGAGVFSLSLNPADDFVVTNGTEATITAEAKNAQGEVTYTWSVTDDGTPGSGEGNVWTIPADAPVGGWWTVYCNANDGTSEDDQWVSFSVVAEPVVYEVTVEQDLVGGRVDVDPTSGVAGTIITVIAAPEDGYRCDGITVNGDPLTGSTFELPEGGAVVSATFVESSTKTATYTVTSVTEVETTGTAPAGSEAVYASTYERTACQLTASNSMTLTLKGYEGATITGLKLSMHSNSGKGAGSLSAKCGEKAIAGIGVSKFNPGWYGEWTTNYVDIVPAVEPTVVDGDVVITISATENSLYCESFTIEYEPGTPAFCITLDRDEDFTVVEGEAFSIEATPRNAVGEVSYAWTVDGVPAETAGNLLSLTAGEASETPHEVVCTATDGGAGEGAEPAVASVRYTVVEAPEMFTVTVADGIENGTVALSAGGEPVAAPAELAEGTEVTVEATPDAGYELEAITVNGEALEGTTTFTVTDNTEVSATFTKIKDYATLPFLAENTPFTGPWKNAKVAGVTSDGLDNDYDSGAAKFIATGNWLQIKFQGTPGTLTYHLQGNGTGADCEFEVQESATGEEGSWSPLATFKDGNALPTAKTNFTHELSADSQFVRFIYLTKGAKGNVALYDVYISSGAFSVAVDKTGFELEEGTADTVTAAAKNGTEPYTFVWTSETAELNGEGAALAIPDTLATGDYAATVTATDADGQTATADVAFTVVEPAVKYPVIIADGILNGTVEADVEEAAEGDTVMLTAHPAPGFKLGILMVSYAIENESENLEFTTSPATFTMPAAKVLVGASFVESHDEIFVPVGSAAEFEAGGEYLIVAHKEGSFTDALKNATNGTRIGVAEVSIETDGYILTDNADIVWKIQTGKEEGQYVLFNEAASVYAAATKNDNLAQLLAEGTNDLAQWTLDLSALPSVKIVSVSYTNRWLQRNTSTAYFATYTGTQTTPMLFKKVESLEFAVSVDKTGFELALGEGTTVTATAKYGVGDVTYVWTSETEDLNGEGAELAIPDTLAEGAYAVTVTATDSSEPPQTDTAEVTFTVAAPAVKYAVTVDQEIANGTIAADKDEAEAGETVTLTATPADGWKLGTFTLNGVPFAGDSFEMPEGGALVSAEFVQIVKYPITVDGEIANGSIAADKDEAEAGETVTLTATPDDGWKLGTFILNGDPIGGNTFEMPEGEALVSAEFVERTMTTYELVENADDFVAGEEYLIVAHSGDSFTSAMKNEANGDRIGLDEVELKTETTIETDNDAIIWVIQAGKGEGQYTLFNAAGVYAAAKSDGNTAQIVTDGTDDLAQWKLDLTGLPAAKIVSASYTNRWLQRNSTANNKYFATYTGSQTTPSLYKKAGFSVGFVDKEDGFTVDEGTADSITAEAVRGVEPYSYEWTSVTPALNGTGETLVIPDTLGAAETPYSVTVTATDSSEPPQTASKTITFEVVPPVVRFEVTVAEGIVGGTVTVDKALAEPGETVTVTATPADGYELVDIRVDGEPIGGDTFEMPAQAVEVSATFREIVDYVTLPFVAEDTPYRGPWKNPEVAGLTHNGLDSDYNTDGVLGAKFRTAGVWMQIKFNGTPGSLTYGIKGNGLTGESGITFRVQESADGETWADLAVYTSDGNLDDDRKDEKAGLSEDSRFVRFFLETKSGEGNVGIYDVYISEAGAAEPVVTVTGETTVRLGDTFELALALENYAGGAYTWTNNVLFGTIDAGTATFWWTPPRTGEFPVTFSAMDGNRAIASTDVTLIVLGEPALVFDGDDEGTVGTPVTFTVEAEYVADPTVSFMGFLEVPEGSALTAADVTVDFPNVTFTPDVAGDYGLGFSAGTAEGGDYVEDLWIVTVAAAPTEPEVLLVDGETTVELGDDFILEFALLNYEGEFMWAAEVGDIDEYGYFTWTPIEAGEFPVVVSAVAGEETIAATTVTLTVTAVGPQPVQPVITSIDVEPDLVTLEYTGDATEAWGTDNLTDADSWTKVEGALVEDGTAIIPNGMHFLRLQ